MYQPLAQAVTAVTFSLKSKYTLTKSSTTAKLIKSGIFSNYCNFGNEDKEFHDNLLTQY